MPAKTKKTPAKTAAKSAKTAGTITEKSVATTATIEKSAATTIKTTKRSPKAATPDSKIVVVGPVEMDEHATEASLKASPASKAPAFESGTVRTTLGNAFDLTLNGAGELVVRYQDRSRCLGTRIQAVVVADPGSSERVFALELLPEGAVNEGRVSLPGTIASMAIAFTGGGRWDSNNSRNFTFHLKG